MLYFYFIHVPKCSKTCLWKVIPNLCKYYFLLTSAFWWCQQFFTSKKKKQSFLHRKVLGKSSKSWIKISCPRIYILICTLVLSLLFIRLFIGFLKKYFQRLLHFTQASWVCCLQISTLQIEQLFSTLVFSFLRLSLYLFVLTRSSTQA